VGIAADPPRRHHVPVEDDRAGLVGRDHELRRLTSAIDSDRPSVVIGEAGIGKTSLVRAAGRAIGIPIREGGGLATLAAYPYLALERACGIGLTGDPSRVAARVEAHVGPDLLFIDDLQWIDPDTLAALELLAGRVLLVLAARAEGPRGVPVNATALTAGHEIIRLGPVDANAARSIVAAWSPDIGATALSRIVDEAGGNPLILREMAVQGAVSPILARTIARTFDGLSASGQRVVEILAVAQQPIRVDRLDRAVSEGLEVGLLSRDGGLVEVRHALLGEAVRARLGASAARRLHARVADVVDDPGEQASHLAAAGLEGRARTIAGAALAGALDPIRRAGLLTILAVTADTAAGPEPRLAAARALRDASDWAGVVRLLDGIEADATSEALAERDTLAGHALYRLGRHDDARIRLGEANARSIDPAGPVAAERAMETAAFMINIDGDLPGAIAVLDDQLARQPVASPSERPLRAIRESAAMLAAQPTDVGYLRDTIELAIAARDFAFAANLARVVTYATMIFEGAEPALRFLDETSARFDDASASTVALEFLAERVHAAVLAGRPADALTYADVVLERPAPRRPWQAALNFRARALGLMGHLDEAVDSLGPLIDAVTDDFVGRGELLATRAELALWGGLTEDALDFSEVAQTVPSPIVNADVLPAITAAWARLELGRVPAPMPIVAPTRVMAGAIPELEGIRLLHDGDPEAAAERFAAASSLWTGFHAPRSMHCRWAEGEALRQAGRFDDAAARLGSALVDATACRFEVVAIRIRRTMRQTGVRPPGEAAPRRSTDGTLTPRERELLELVGQGLTNLEVARRMGLGRPTVARILSNAMTKLGASSRAQAVVLATPLD
jgi:DNA-binding CsgD family transcriptional regulator